VRRALAIVAGGAAFVLLATANSGGYRYGVSDQAYYQPAIVHALDPATFPRDRALLATQSKFLISDQAIAALVAMTGGAIERVFLGVYLLGLLGLFAAALAFSRALRFSPMATTALLLLMTFRHRIARTGANSLEGYLHMRTLAFAAGVAALAAIASGRLRLAALAILMAAAIHPTTALWFAIVWAVAVWVRHPASRRGLALAGAAAAAGALWLLTSGPLAGRLVVMDRAWLDVLGDKDYLFPTDWPLYAWTMNLLYPVIVVAVYRARRRAGVTSAGERALTIGLMALAVVFAISVPLTMMHVALAVQLQVPRVFWLLDFAAIAAIAWAMMQARASSRGVAIALIGLLAAASVGRSAFVLTRSGADVRLFTPSLPGTPWVDVLSWLRSQPMDWHVLADPEHGWRQGISVRVGASRDTLIEASKDASIGMYDRAVAMRVADRAAATSGYEGFDDARLRTLAERYDLDVAIVRADRPTSLPVLYRNSAFAVLDLR
jgi:hypothetical protein